MPPALLACYYCLMRVPRLVLLLAIGLFALSVAGTLVSLGVFFVYDTDFWEHFDVDAVLDVATTLLLGLLLSSGVLYLHFRSRESYMTFETILFLVLVAISLVNILWLLPATLLV